MLMTSSFDLVSSRDTITEILHYDGAAALAIIIAIEGPSYRPLGATMAILDDGTRVGTLSSGCIEADIAQHALDTLETGDPVTIRYGQGSPFFDIQLPCGGGLDILILPRPDKTVLAQLDQQRNARVPYTLEIDVATAAMTLSEIPVTALSNGVFQAHFQPDVRFLVFGKGPEASTFSALVTSSGYPNLLLSPDAETLEEAERFGGKTVQLTSKSIPDNVKIDPRTAVILFFHDHDWEPGILADALATEAFYIGAQGSRRARDARLLELEAMGVSETDRSRLFGPVGLIPSVRDAKTLAVSTLAEILAEAA
ncbi:MAG: XdhC family protein [Cognatishimia sp.]|uniref:XdhC family protein n=1 Tax=Cognatishimia sp. TaxID=2211648 RepID=UPI003B8D902B